MATAEAYQRMLKALLPPGAIWVLDPDSPLAQALLASADELARVDARAAALVEEADPRTTDELLEDFERELGLDGSGTDDERRALVVALLLRRQRYRPVDFQTTLALILGQDAEDVVVLERTAADALAMDDEREIFRFFVYRDPLEAGTYDIAAAQAVIDRMKPSHTLGYAIESIDLLCDDEFSLCDRDLLGV